MPYCTHTKILGSYLKMLAQNWGCVSNGLLIINFLCIWEKLNAYSLDLRENSEQNGDFSIECNGHTIKAQYSVKYLGLNLDDQLTGEEIVNSILQKVNGRLKFLYRQCNFLEEKLRKSICSALIQCHLDYTCSSWYSVLNKQLEKKLQICQNKTVRFIKKNLGPRSHVGFSELDSLNMVNVELRIKQLRLSHAYKIYNETGPSYLREHFVKTSDVHQHFTRGSTEKFVVPSVSAVAATTFCCSAIKDWNSLPLDIKQKSTFNGFKTAVKHCLRTHLQLMETDNFIYYS